MTHGLRSPRRTGAILLAALAALAAGGVALLWAWNTVAVELFAAPAIGFRHAFAAELAVAILAAIAATAARLGHRRPEVPR